MPDLNVIDPRGIDFGYWASVLHNDNEGVLVPPRDVLEWRLWAIRVRELDQDGIPDPEDYPDWREWAMRLNEVSNADE